MKDDSPNRPHTASAARLTAPDLVSAPIAADFSATLLEWYDRHRRILPWRAAPGRSANPYHVWLSEIMLQQTTVATVRGYFENFLSRWPTVEKLAAASLDDVLHAWQGLGYYARARNLHKCAQVVATDFAGRFPDTADALKELSGIGDYTSAAIAAIAFDRAETVVDGNVERVIARLFSLSEPLPGVKPALRRAAATLTPAVRPGDYAQAMMDLGATLCVPRAPKCVLCPVRAFCQGVARGNAPDLPRKAKKAPKPTRRGIAFWLVDGKGRVLLRRRPERGLLGGLMEVPSTDWAEGPLPSSPTAPVDADWQVLPGVVRHTFTHFHLELTVWAAGTAEANAASGVPGLGVWQPIERLGDVALPTAMKKLVGHALRERHGQ